jgi:6-phosphogluconolactonase
MKRTAASALQLYILLFLVTIMTGGAMAQPFAYVANENSNSVSGYSIAPGSGALTQLPGSPFGAGTNPDAIQFTPDAKYAYVANYGSATVSAYSLNGTNGALTPIAGSPFPTDGNPITLAISPSGKFLYTGNSDGNPDDNGISGFSIDGATGALTPVPGSPFFQFKEYFPGPFAFTPSGAYLYASSVFGLNSYIAGFALNADGSLTELTGSPFSSSYPDGLAVAPSGNFLFVGDYNGFIEVYGINGSTGALTLVNSVPTLDTYPVIEVTTSAGEFLYGGVTQFGDPSGSVNGFQIDTTTGGLTGVPGSPFPAGSNPQSLAGSSSGRFLYAADAQNNQAFGYSINAATGALTPIAGSPFATGSTPESVALANPALEECGASTCRAKLLSLPVLTRANQ